MAPIKSVVAERILDILESYGFCGKQPKYGSWLGKQNFMPVVSSIVTTGARLPLVLPAFPFKSPNRTSKVLGALPDLGEELALRHLDGLCSMIEEVYPPGAELFIVSDGIVYNDLLGVTNEDVWEYGEAIRVFAAENCDHITFVRLWDFLEQQPQSHSSASPKENYLSQASYFRDEIVSRYGETDFDVRRHVREDSDACATYCGYIKFLSKDLQHNTIFSNLKGNQLKKKSTEVARAMITRGKAFAAVIKAYFSHCVRLSIHPSNGESKLPMSLIPQKDGSFGQTPWHSCIALEKDGSFTTTHAELVCNTHELVYKDGRPYYFREKCDMYQWGSIDIFVQPLYPCGLLIEPQDRSEFHSIRDVDMHKVRQLGESQSPIVIRGFGDSTNEEVFQSKARQLGEIQPWKYGVMEKVCVAGTSNIQMSNKAMPMHYDGIFMFESSLDATTCEATDVRKSKVPKFQFFTNIKKAPKDAGGLTLFASSRLMFRYLPDPWTLEKLEQMTWSIETDGYWKSSLTNLPLVIRHPTMAAPCLRYHEPWSQDQSASHFNTISIDNASDDESDTNAGSHLISTLNKLLYDRRVSLRFAWNQGDVVLSDNIGMMHTRTAFQEGSERELWRIHVN